LRLDIELPVFLDFGLSDTCVKTAGAEIDCGNGKAPPLALSIDGIGIDGAKQAS
jgi:hypothetical protein